MFDRRSTTNSMITLRAATKSDSRAIRSLVWQSRINPIGLSWQRFVVAVDIQGQVVGCGQIKPHAGDLKELASIAVAPGWRGKGVGRAVVNRLLEGTSGALYLTCRSELGDFYSKFGFKPVKIGDMPVYYRRIALLFAFFRRLFPQKSALLVMVRHPHV